MPKSIKSKMEGRILIILKKVYEVLIQRLAHRETLNVLNRNSSVIAVG